MTAIGSDEALVAPLDATLVQSLTDRGCKDIVFIKGSSAQRLSISFKRTVRVPDGQRKNKTPPALGTFPLYPQISANDASKLVLPMYQREAMWIHFSASRPFAVQIYVGGVNAVSGELRTDDQSKTLRRLTKMANKESIQDYIVAPEQLWLDGIADKQGSFRQIVAMPLGSGYSVEAQITGRDEVGGMQFMVVPSHPPPYTPFRGPPAPGTMSLFVKMATGKTLHIHNVVQDTTIEQLQQHVEAVEGLSVDQQRMIWSAQPLNTLRTVGDYGISEGSIIYLFLRIRASGGPPIKHFELGIAPVGLIKQYILEDSYPSSTWDIDHAISFNSQLFQQVTGMAPPETPISARTYASQGLPFFEIYNETSTIEGDFGDVKSVDTMDAEKSPMKSEAVGAGKFRTGVEIIENPIVLLNPDGTQHSFKPVGVLKAELKRLNHAQF